MGYKILTTPEFDKTFKKLDSEIQKQISKEIDQLEDNPYSGKPLGYKYLREKKLDKYRVFYLIYEEYVVVFVISLSAKKDQQKSIDIIKKLIPYYREEIKKRFNSRA